MKRFHGVCLISNDVRRLRDFYAAVLGIDVVDDEASLANRHAVLASEGAALSFYSAEAMEGMAPGSMQGAGVGSLTLQFEVEDVDLAYERLVALDVPIVKPPTTHPWGTRSLWFRDPDGNTVDFTCAVRPD
jgi:catechol 2,3-dioxygenase-like lactoylglutathione lyase family enzyme